jgi:HAD superfamily hydrolase (TIGR01509 family)
LQIKGIFFDLGGTLFSYAGGLGGGGIRHVVRRLGIQATPEEIGRAWRRASRNVGERYGAQPYFLHSDLFRDTLIAFLQDFDHQPTPGLAEEFHERQRQEVVGNLPIREECRDALAALRERGLYLSIVSNIDDDYLEPLVDKHRLHDLLHHWTSSEEARSCKPDTAIFHYSLRKSGLRAEEVLFVGDSLHHDVAGADAAGMRSARIVEPGVVTPLTHGLEVTAQPDWEINQLTELVSLVEELNGG